MRKIDISQLPELPTAVGLQGSAKQKEVGGPICLSALVGIAIILINAK